MLRKQQGLHVVRQQMFDADPLQQPEGVVRERAAIARMRRIDAGVVEVGSIELDGARSLFEQQPEAPGFDTARRAAGQPHYQRVTEALFAPAN